MLFPFSSAQSYLLQSTLTAILFQETITTHDCGIDIGYLNTVVGKKRGKREGGREEGRPVMIGGNSVYDRLSSFSYLKSPPCQELAEVLLASGLGTEGGSKFLSVRT